jgi:hypothetical protein
LGDAFIQRPLYDEALTRPGESTWSREQGESELAQTRQRGYATFRRPERFTTILASRRGDEEAP